MTAVNHPTSPLRTLHWLLKREYWENRGGFLFAPIIAGLISLLMSAAGIGLGLYALKRAASSGNLSVDNTDISINGLDLAMLTRNLDAGDLADLGGALDMTVLIGSSWPFMVLAFVVFFYCLGALYDDRRDRSILFWKSLPLSDTQTVLSKLISALVVAPLIAILASIVTMFLFAGLLSVVVLVHGGSPGALVWGTASPLTLAAGHLAWLPVFALWALPTAGWLMLCSAWARSKPFLWAVMMPLLAGAVVQTLNLMPLFGLTKGWFWQHIVGRLLLGTFPGMDLLYRTDSLRQAEGVAAALSPSQSLQSLAMPELWIGAAFGAAFIVAAIVLRRRAGEI